jgi:isochorismate synthase
VPLASVGATFDPRRSGAPWEGWPAAWATIPARLLWSSGQRSGMILHLPGDTARSQQVANETFDRIATDLAEVPPTPPPFASLPTREPAEQVEAWRARVARALAAIGAGDLQKLVLARAVTHTLAGGAEWDVGATLARLPATDAGAIRFATSPPGARGVVVGATPEVLGRLDGRRVETAALAGTCPRGADPVEDEALAARLLASDKDRREHALVVEAIADALRPLCAQLDLPAAPTLRRLRDVQHLESRFQGTATPGTGVLDLAARLHPTPAVAGAPRDAALAWLRDHEPLARGAYAGAVGYVNPQGGGALAVAIRSALLDGARAWTFAGAGVVPGSDPQAEWDETELKLRTVEGALTARPGGRV